MGKSGSATANALLGGAILYLAAHAITGRQGLVAFLDMQVHERALSSRLDALNHERADLEARALRMRQGALDIDYLDERARLVLAAGDNNEIVFALP